MSPRPRVPVRKQVLDLIRKYPGLHVRGVEAQLGLSGPLALYHLRKLDERGYVESRESGGYLRYYPTAKAAPVGLTEADKKILGYLREEAPLGILLTMLDEGPLPNKDLADRLGLAASTLSYHLAKLGKDGVVHQLADRRYAIRHPGRVEAILLTYNPTPDLLRRFADLWGGLYGS